MADKYTFDLIVSDNDGHFFTKPGAGVDVCHYHPKDGDRVFMSGMFTAYQLRQIADILDESIASVKEAA